RELAHRAFLLLRQLLGHADLYLDDEIALLVILLDPMPADAEPFPVRRPGWDANRHTSALERFHTDLRAERCLRDVDRHGSDDVESLAFEESVRIDLKADQQIAGRPVARASSTLPFQTNSRPRIDADGNGDDDFFRRAHFPRAAA